LLLGMPKMGGRRWRINFNGMMMANRGGRPLLLHRAEPAGSCILQ
jgi:hypothetical protein